MFTICDLILGSRDCGHLLENCPVTVVVPVPPSVSCRVLTSCVSLCPTSSVRSSGVCRNQTPSFRKTQRSTGQGSGVVDERTEHDTQGHQKDLRSFKVFVVFLPVVHGKNCVTSRLYLLVVCLETGGEKRDQMG